MKTCQIESIIKNEFPGFPSTLKCHNSSLPIDPKGLCILHSQRLDKDRTEFYAAIQKKIYNNNFDFSFVLFPAAISFEKQEFTKDTTFEDSIFICSADFCKAKFNGIANFRGTEFCGPAYFREAEFKGITVFSFAEFFEKSEFYGSNFYEFSIFEGTNFTKSTEFFFSSFYERSIFVDISDPFIANFQEVEVKKDGSLQFQNLSLATCIFKGSDLRLIGFHNVQWRNYYHRKIIYDEYYYINNSLLKGMLCIFPPIEQLYRYLKINYEQQGDYKNSGDFHYGEMEMHRRGSRWRWFPFYWYNLYRFLSGYGERPIWALGWLAVFLAVFTGLLAWAGLEILDPKYSPTFGNPFFYLLQKVTLQRPTWAEPVGFLGKLVAGLSVLLIPGQAALFLLALRNRLGRRR